MKTIRIGMLAGIVLCAFGGDVGAQTTYAWSNTGASTAWYTSTNWSPNVSSGSWATADLAQFNNTGTATTSGINMGTASLSIGAIEVTSARTRNLTIGNSSGTVGTLTLNGTTVNSVSNVILRSAMGNTFTLQDNETGTGKTMNIALGGTSEKVIVLDGSGNIVISSVISGASSSNSLTISGAGSGRVDFTGTANTFTRPINITGSELRISDNGSLGNANNSITLDGGRLAIADGTTVTIASSHNIFVGDTANTAITVPGSGVLTFNGVLADVSGKTGVLVKEGAGSLVLGGANTYTGTTTINAGTIQFASQGSLYNNTPASWTASNIVVKSGATLALNVGGTGEFTTSDVTTLLTNLGGLGGSVAVNNGLTAGSAIAFDTTNASGGNFTVSDNIADSTGVGGGAISLTKLGTGTLTLSGTNTYTGGTTVSAGTLALGHATNTLRNTGAVTVSGGTLSLGSNNDTVGVVTLTSGSITSSTGVLTGSSYSVSSGTVSASLAGSGTLTKSGTGTVILSGTNTYTGTTSVSAGTLQFTKQLSLYNNTPASWTKTNITVNSGGTLALNVGGSGEFTTSNVTTILGSSGLGGSVSNNGLRSGSRIGFDTTNASGGNFTITDVIANTTGTGGGNVGLTKLGSGTLTLTGDNTYDGATTVNAGTLLINGNQSTATGAVTVNNTGTLGGTGTVGGATTVASGGTIRGDSGTGTGTLNVKNVTIQSVGNLAANIAANGTNSTLAFGSNSLDFATTGSVLKLSSVSGFDHTIAGTYTLGTFTNANSIKVNGVAQSGNLGTYIEGTGASGAITIDVANVSGLAIGDQFSLDVSGNNLVLTFTPVPEPATVLGIAVAALGVGGLIRRRLRKPANETVSPLAA